jgi:hypothetical protein
LFFFQGNPDPRLHVGSVVIPDRNARIAVHFDLAFFAVEFLRAVAKPVIVLHELSPVIAP